jgi:hypothetical protein
LRVHLARHGSPVTCGAGRPTEFCSRTPCFHSLDYFLTLEGARVRKLRAAEVIQMSGSYELNPLFKRVIDEGR